MHRPELPTISFGAMSGSRPAKFRRMNQHLSGVVDRLVRHVAGEPDEPVVHVVDDTGEPVIDKEGSEK